MTCLGRLGLVCSIGAALLPATLWPGSSAATGAPANLSPPQIMSETTHEAVGSVVHVGEELYPTLGTWSPEPDGYTYTWFECDANAMNCTAILGATNTDYTVTAEDLGMTIEVQVTPYYGDQMLGTPATSAPATVEGPVQPTIVTAPVIGTDCSQDVTHSPVFTPTCNTTAPAVVGQRIEIQARGQWMPTRTSLTDTWIRCDPACSPIPGSTDEGYVVTAADMGYSIELQEVADNNGVDSAPADSNAIAVPAPTPDRGPTLSIGPFTRVSNGTGTLGLTFTTFAGVESIHIAQTPTAFESNATLPSFKAKRGAQRISLPTVVSPVTMQPSYDESLTQRVSLSLNQAGVMLLASHPEVIVPLSITVNTSTGTLTGSASATFLTPGVIFSTAAGVSQLEEAWGYVTAAYDHAHRYAGAGTARITLRSRVNSAIGVSGGDTGLLAPGDKVTMWVYRPRTTLPVSLQSVIRVGPEYANCFGPTVKLKANVWTRLRATVPKTAAHCANGNSTPLTAGAVDEVALQLDGRADLRGNSVYLSGFTW
jgi:hypothetical protein